MAVYTEVGADELEAFLAAYPVGRVLSFKGIAEGVENSNYYLHTEKGTFILTLFEKRVREEDLPFFVGLMEHLSGRGFPCPRPLAAEGGRTLGRLAGKPCAVVTFLDGLSFRRPTPEHCRQLGAAMARMPISDSSSFRAQPWARQSVSCSVSRWLARLRCAICSRDWAVRRVM